MSAKRDIRYRFRKKETSGSTLPFNSMLAEPFVNTFEGRMFFSGTPGGTYGSIEGQANVFEVGGNVSTLMVYSAINLNNMFIVTGSTGEIITYGGVSDLSNLFLSGTSEGLVLAPISDLTVSGDYLPLSGGTVTGLTVFTDGLNANKININAPGSSSFPLAVQAVDNFIATYRDVSGEDVFLFVGSLSGGDLRIGIGDYADAYNLPSYEINTANATHRIRNGNVYIGNAGGYIPNEKLYVDGSTFISGGFSASALFSGSTNLYDIFAAAGSDTNTYTTGVTLSNENLIFDRNDLLSAYSVSLSAFTLGSVFNAHTGDTNNPHQTALTGLTDIAFSATSDVQVLISSGNTWQTEEVVDLEDEVFLEFNVINLTAATIQTSGITISTFETIDKVATGTTDNDYIVTKGYVDDRASKHKIPVTGSTYTLNETSIYDEIILLVSADCTITIDTDQLSNSSLINIKAAGNYSITVVTEGAETIDGETTQTLNNYENMKLVSNVSNWFII